jgi:hypothetical protein
MNTKLPFSRQAFRLLCLFALPLILMVLSGCNALLTPEPLPPTATATQTLTVTPTIDWFPATATPTLQPRTSSTPQPTLSVEREGVTELLISDDFTQADLWSLSQSSTGNIALGTQNLTFAISKQNASLTSISEHIIPANFYLEITAENTLCLPSDQVGILFWHESVNDFYRLLVDCSGRYRLELIQGGRAYVVYDWETAPEINLAIPSTNRFGLWAHQGTFQLFINDAFQFEAQVAKNRSGNFGLFARTIAGTAMTVRFSDLEIFKVDLP